MTASVTSSGTRLVAIYAAGLALGAIWLAFLVFSRSFEYIAFLPIGLAAFALPWSLIGLVWDAALIGELSIVGGIVLNTVLLYRLGQAHDKRQQRQDHEQAI